MFGFLFSWFIGQHATQISCTKTKTLPNLRTALVVTFYKPKATSTLQCGDTAEKAKEDETAVAEDLVEEEDEEEEEEDRDNDVEDVEEMSN